MSNLVLDFGNPMAAAIDALHEATAIYTENHVIRSLLDRTDWPSGTGRLIDPSAGDGNFLVQALLRLRPEPGDHAATARIHGWEIHPAACSTARIRLRETLTGLGWTDADARTTAYSMITEADFLTKPPAASSIRFIFGNPPYLRAGNLPRLFQNLYSKIVPAYARGDILHAFLDLCARIMTHDGLFCAVSSDRWLLNTTSASLRAHIGALAGISHLERIDVSTSFYRPKQRRSKSPPRVRPVTIVLEPMRPGLMRLDAQPIYPRDPALAKPVLDLGPTVPLSSIATIRLGPWLGPKGIFYFDAGSREAKALRREGLVLVTDTSDLPPDRDEITPATMLALRTSKAAIPSRTVLHHLRKAIVNMPKSKVRKTWWLPPERLPPSPETNSIVIPRIAPRLRAVSIASGVIPINHNFSVLSACPGRIGNDRLIEILRHPVVQQTVAFRAPRLENGYLDLRTGFLKQLPIPIALIEG